VSARPAERRDGSGGVWALVAIGLLVAANTSNPASPRAGRPPGGPPSSPSSGARPPAGLTFTSGAGCRPAGDYPSPRLDRRVRVLLVAIATHHRIRVSCLRTGHSRYVAGTRRVSNHSVWRAVDVDQVDGHPVSRSNVAAHALALWIGQGGAGVQPSEVGSPWDVGRHPWFSDPGHRDHLHVGFAGPTQAGGGR
jgi:hypothetical protein